MEASATLVSIDEYLHTSYEPDCDYVDGRLLERNVGQKTHSKIQAILVRHFGTNGDRWSVEAFPEVRIRVSPTRFRIPDVTVVLRPEPQEEVFTTPPFLCIEILSPGDTVQDMQEKVDDYLAFGVPNIWIINPRNRKGYTVSEAGTAEVKDGVLRTSKAEILLPLHLIF